MTATTSDRQAFLDKIAENPEDLTTRFAFADWADEKSAEMRCFECGGLGRVTPDYGFQWGDCPSCTEPFDPKEFAQLACDQRLYVAAQAVIARHDDDGPRLEYAKIAEAYGRVERAEFIRVQCELARRVLENAWGDGSDLRRRQHQLWQLILPTFKPAEILMISFDQDSEADLGEGSYALVRRGFVDTVSMTLNQFLTHGPAICREHPVQPHAGMVTDKRPAESALHRGFFRWYVNDGDHPDENEILREIFNLLGPSDDQPPQGYDDQSHLEWYFPNREAAMLALSRAIIKWARGERR
jgi:uncharacterized protein (TIGR02996 family)